MLLVIDQFEELLTLCSDPGTRRRFLDSLLAAPELGAEKTVPPLGVVLSLQADFMGHALSHHALADCLQDASLMLGPMTQDELRAAIEQPAQKQGAAFEAGLVNRILDDVGDEPGTLPLLEFALTLLWEQAESGWLTHGAYDAIGKVDGALARYAEEVYAAPYPGQQDGARRVFLQLIRTGEGTDDSRRVATRAELGEQNWPLAQYLADCRLVVTSRDGGGAQTVEVVHEELINGWQRLQNWIEADRAFRTWQERLRAAQQQWELSDHDDGALLHGAPLAQAENWLVERGIELSPAEVEYIQAGVALREARQLERERRRRWTVVALAGGLLIAVVLAIVAFGARTSAERETAVNHSLVLAAGAQDAFETEETDLALALALEAVGIDQPPHEAVRTLTTITLGPGTRSVFAGHSSAVQAIAFSPDGSTALSGSCGQQGPDGTCVRGELSLWDVGAAAQTGTELRRFEGHTNWVEAVAFSPDGRTALSGSRDAKLILWNAETGKEIRRLEGYQFLLRSVATSRDGRTALAGSQRSDDVEEGELILWDLETGRQIRRFDTTEDVTSVVFSSDRSRALTASAYFANSTLWDVASGQPLQRFTGHTNMVFDVAFGPEEKTALSVSADGSVIRWDLETGDIVRRYLGHDDMVWSLDISPDGRTVLSGSMDGTIILWDLESGEELRRLQGHTELVPGLAFGPGAQTAFSVSLDGALVEWQVSDLPLDELIEGPTTTAMCAT